MSRKITLAEPWSYRTPEKTINYPAGEHTVYNYVAEQAEAEGVIAKEDADAAAERPAEVGETGAADGGESE